MRIGKKLAILVLLLWTAVGGTLIFLLGETDENQVLEAFGRMEGDRVRGRIVAEGQNKGEYLTQGRLMEEMDGLCEALGVKDVKPEQALDGNRRSVVVRRETPGSRLEISLCTYEASVEEDAYQLFQYATLELEVFDYVGELLYLKEMVEEALSESSFVCSVGLELEAEFPGTLSDSERKGIAEELLEQLDVDVAWEHEEPDLMNVYGFSDRIADWELVDGKKLNVSLSFTYDELREVTEFLLKTSCL